MLRKNYIDLDDAECNKKMKKLGGSRVAGQVTGLVLGLLGIGLVVVTIDMYTAIPEEKFTDQDAAGMIITAIFGAGVFVSGVIITVASEILAAILMSIRYTAKQSDA